MQLQGVFYIPASVKDQLQLIKKILFLNTSLSAGRAATAVSSVRYEYLHYFRVQMSSFTLQQKIDIVEHILALLLMFPSIFSLQMIQDSPYGLS